MVIIYGLTLKIAPLIISRSLMDHCMRDLYFYTRLSGYFPSFDRNCALIWSGGTSSDRKKRDWLVRLALLRALKGVTAPLTWKMTIWYISIFFIDQGEIAKIWGDKVFSLFLNFYILKKEIAHFFYTDARGKTKKGTKIF